MSQDEKGVVKYVDRAGQEIRLSFELVKTYLVVGKRELVTPQEIMFFMGICKARGLNPFAKDCYLVKYTDAEAAAIIVSRDFFRSRARAQEDCQGWHYGIILEDKSGNIRYSKGLIKEGENLLGGWFKARPKGWADDFELEVNLKGYIKKNKEGRITRFWAEENQPTMIAKVAESQGLRTLWPNEFSKLYTEEEILAEVIDLPQAELDTGEKKTATESLAERTRKPRSDKGLSRSNATPAPAPEEAPTGGTETPQERPHSERLIDSDTVAEIECYCQQLGQVASDIPKRFNVNRLNELTNEEAGIVIGELLEALAPQG